MYGSNVPKAKRFCSMCSVRQLCLAAALTNREPDGVWGGFTTVEREMILKANPEDIPALLRKFAHRDSRRRPA
jgi:hypothetical protein